MIKKFIVIFIILLSNIYAISVKEDIKLNERMDKLDKRVFNLEQEMLFLNANLKRIDKNFQTMITIIRSDRYTPEERIRPVAKKVKKYNIYVVLKDNTNVYADDKGKIILYKLYKGDIVNINSCNCNKLLKKCLCKFKNKEAYIEKNKILKDIQ